MFDHVGELVFGWMALKMESHCWTENTFYDGEMMDGNACIRCYRIDKNQSIRQTTNIEHGTMTQILKTTNTFLSAIGDFEGLNAAY
jgi:hypothetical protein